MYQNKYCFLLLIFALSFSFPLTSYGQLVNMEETWQEFLVKEKTSNVSKLVKPEKSQPANYLKWCLMYANSYFCADNVPRADELMLEIKKIGTEVQDRIPGFKERHDGLVEKIKAYKKLVPVWERFLQNKSSVTRKDLAANPEAKAVCEKGTLCKYFYMMSHAYYCEGNLEDSRDHFENRVLKLAKTSFDPKTIAGLNEEIEMLKEQWANIDVLNPAWTTFIQTDVSPGYTKELTEITCYTVPNIKACLLRAAADFCGLGDDMLQKIKELKAMNDHTLPGDVADKIQWLEDAVNKKNADLNNLNTVWEAFTPKDKLPNGASYKHLFVCDREAEVKAYLMDGLSKPCEVGPKALDSIARIRKDHQPSLGNVTTSKLKKLKALVENEAANVATLNKAWADFLPDDKLSGGIDFVFEYCDKVAQTRAYVIDGMLDVCNKGQQRLDDIENVKANYAPDLDDKTLEKIQKLQDWVDKLNRDLEALKSAWKHLLSNKEVSKELAYEHEFICNRAAEVQAYVLDGFVNPCVTGKLALENVAKVRAKYSPQLDGDTEAKIKELRSFVEDEAEKVAALNKAWKDFLPDNKLSGGIDFVFEYCDKIAQTRAYIIDGTINFCEKARTRMEDVGALRAEHDFQLDADTKAKLDGLQEKINQADADTRDLEAAWTLYKATDTTMYWIGDFPAKDEVVRGQIRLVDFYCDKISQTKSWVIKGLLNPCDKGDGYMAKIKDLKQKHNLSYDSDLACQVHRLEGKIWQCKYWAMVLKARKITHQERETFGPLSAKIMYNDLNSDKQPCETTVVYEPLGYIGIKYVIAPHLCEKVNLAKMGDPLYYKKIASWVDREVLTKYCTASMRCKEDFFIYLEGHTDGYRFSGREYDRSLDIPVGTPYTHFHGQKDGTVDTLQKTTRNITSKLENNMELGIARAWSVKAQLDFMNVPITIGAYEHPEHEKGGEFRRIDIELNMTNLLLDFYQKTLDRLVKESGIGGRPTPTCE